MIYKKIIILILIFFFNFLLVNNTLGNEKDYFLTLKYNKVKVRQGPSFEYPVKFIYKKKYLPVKIIDSKELIQGSKMNKLFLALSFFMGVVVLVSNYLVQFPIKYYGLEEILTYGAFSYPIAFLITDLANRRYGKLIAKKIVYFGFFLGVLLTLYFSTNFSDLISIRIAIGSGTAFITAQLLSLIHI